LEPVTSAALIEFLSRLGEHSPRDTVFYILGGSALSILGNPRQTLDIDYTTELQGENQEAFSRLVDQMAAQLHLDVEAVPIEEFVPLPPGASARRRYIGSYGNLEVYVFDLYTIALSKISRGFESDLEDVLFLLRQGLIDLSELQSHFFAILPDAPKADIDPREFKAYFEEVKKQFLAEDR
jgi:hypothetical protein